ncbi:DUF3795 domain-containing protein [archaeon]|jgi:hypothetical protein|nr:DUF3795 domain-containing protein [archaeon]
MNCAICIGYLREKNKCPGCKLQGKSDSKYFKKCSVKNCNVIKDNNWDYCSPKCEKFPCKRLKDLDKRYTIKYNMSMIDNLNFIEINGIKIFIEQQKSKYIKSKKIFCIHKKEYFDLK